MGFDQTLAVVFCVFVIWMMMQMNPENVIAILGLGSFFYIIGGA